MAKQVLKPWKDVCILRDEIRTKALTMALLTAVSLGFAPVAPQAVTVDANGYQLQAFVWNNVLVVEPSITRLILIGVILIVLMNARPQGLLGTTRVEIV